MNNKGLSFHVYVHPNKINMYYLTGGITSGITEGGLTLGNFLVNILISHSKLLKNYVIYSVGF